MLDKLEHMFYYDYAARPFFIDSGRFFTGTLTIADSVIRLPRPVALPGQAFVPLRSAERIFPPQVRGGVADHFG